MAGPWVCRGWEKIKRRGGYEVGRIRGNAVMRCSLKKKKKKLFLVLATQTVQQEEYDPIYTRNSAAHNTQ